ncbi:hypothetical protein FZEAL_9889 [Fusarium zealandicum]|uniref:Methyltransferase n=1 Tax=Fusarium zealandicum TaxID=1053134 RepID=A0A8H4U813_9HYPO|nr:hypothetical protein FZEAL_9889 [Fusarium zealandicum]
MADVLSENQAYFNKIAEDYDERNADAVAQLERGLQQKIQFIGVKERARFLDYACGTGMLSRVLAQYTSESIGVDVSENMVGAYNAQAQSQASSRRAYQGNLFDPADPSPEALSDAKFSNFDVAGVGLAFHHFDDCQLAAKRLAERLKSGGVLFIVDFATHETSPENAAGRGITHHGFYKEQIQGFFENAGLGDFAYEEFPEAMTITCYHSGVGHDHGNGHDHGHSHGHQGDAHGHGDEQKGPSSMTRTMFVARASKL